MSTNNTITVMVNPDKGDLNRVWAVKTDETSYPYAVYPSGDYVRERQVEGWRTVEVPIPVEPFKDGDVVDCGWSRLARVESEWLRVSGYNPGINYMDDDEIRDAGYTYVGNINDMGKS